MKYPFALYGRVIRIHRAKAAYERESLDTDGEGTLIRETVEQTRYCNTLEQAEAVAKAHNGTTTELDSSAYEWLDGIEVADVPDTYGEAVRIYEMGQAAYERERDKPTPEETVAALGNQVTDLQMALCDMYETMERTVNAE